MDARTITMSPSEVAKAILAAKWDGELPVDPIAIANSLGLKVYFSGEVESGGGELQKVNGQPAVFVCANDSPVRQRFTIFHELGHYVLGHYDGSKTLHRKYGISFDNRELEADAFAAEMLMPESSLRAHVRNGCSFGELLNTFQASTPAMDRRLKSLGIV